MLLGYRARALARIFALFTLSTILALVSLASASLAGTQDLVISQVYGGGGNAGSVYKNDFIELHNRGTSSVSLAGWSVQYGSSAGTTAWTVTALSGSIAPGGYYLVQEAVGTGGTTSLPTPDATGTIAMSATAGKVVLVNSITALTGACPGGPTVMDEIGFGGANCVEGTTAPTLSNTNSAQRANNGCTDTDNNSADFVSAAAAPRNSASPLISCQYTLDTSSSPLAGGSVTRAPDQATYLDGTNVQLTAAPAPNWNFTGWSGDASGLTNPVTVAMGGARNVTANFTITTHTLAVGMVGSGSVAKSPDQAAYDHGSNVVLTAVPATGWHFAGWSGDASGNANPLPMTMDADKSVTATFEIDTHALTVGIVGSGTVAKSPDQPNYDYGASVQLTPAAATGWHFVGWSGAASGNADPLTVTMDADKTITATFEIDTHSLTVGTTGSGTVARSPDQPSYDYGASVQLTASPAPGWHFVDWSGGATGGANPVTITMDADKTVTANFAIDTYTLNVATAGNGTVGKSPDQASYASGSTVDLTATPATGWHFVGWSGSASGSANPLTLTMDGNKSVTATFEINQQTLAVGTSGSGSVGKTPDQPTYDYGSSVQLAATPAANWHFTGWSGDASGNANPLTVTMDANKAITANFAIDTHALSVVANGSGSVTKSPDQAAYDHGSSVQLTATPATGWHFTAWSGDASGTANPVTLVMDGDKSVTATFAKNSVVVSQVYGGGGNSGATLTNDFVELFNRGTDPIDVTGWTVQYGSASGTTWSATLITGVILPGRYYLVQEAAGAGGTTSLPAPDASGSIAMSATAGKVALVNGSTVLTGACPTDATIEDLVGYGAANCSETSVGPGLSNTTADLRVAGGCQDTDNNSADFATGAPAPRNSASPANSCQFTIAVSVDPPGSGSVGASPFGPSYVDGSLVQLTATAVSGFHFSHWTGDVTGGANPSTLTMNSNKSVVAHFQPNALASQMVISQVYGGGGNAGATYRHDYIELYNRGNAAQDVTGWSVQYASAAGGPWSSSVLVGTVAPGHYYLVEEAAGAGGTTELPAADAIGTIAVGSTDGKVALISSNILLASDCPADPSIVDMLGYGVANCSETAPAPATGNTLASFRGHGGCDETNNNSADFANGLPAPRNSASPVNNCPMWTGVGGDAATELALSSPAPNPTRGASRFEYALPVEARVRLTVVDVQGRVISGLVDGVMPAGRHQVLWSGASAGQQVRPGIYFVRLEVSGQRMARTVVVMR